MATEPPETKRGRPAKLSLARLSTAFSQLMGGKRSSTAAASPAVSPQQIVEGLLFVGEPGGEPLSAEELSRPIRDLEPEEIPRLIEQLNQDYRDQRAAYEIVQRGGGYQMQLCDALESVARRMAGVDGEQKLSAASMEVLSIVAYRPGISAEQVNRLRGRRSNAILARLVRWRLLEADASSEGSTGASYRTTPRFHRAAGIDSPADLPQIETLEDGAAAAAP